MCRFERVRFGVDGNFENHEQLKYAPNFYRIMTNQRVESLVMKGNWEQIRFLLIVSQKHFRYLRFSEFALAQFKENKKRKLSDGQRLVNSFCDVRLVQKIANENN